MVRNGARRPVGPSVLDGLVPQVEGLAYRSFTGDGLKAAAKLDMVGELGRFVSLGSWCFFGFSMLRA